MKGVAQVRDKLDGVDYIFLDEVSMLSCHDLYRICAQIARAFNIHDLPFGGKNIIFAGDFAQLPPVGGRESSLLYSGTIGSYALNQTLPSSEHKLRDLDQSSPN